MNPTRSAFSMLEALCVSCLLASLVLQPVLGDGSTSSIASEPHQVAEDRQNHLRGNRRVQLIGGGLLGGEFDDLFGIGGSTGPDIISFDSNSGNGAWSFTDVERGSAGIRNAGYFPGSQTRAYSQNTFSSSLDDITVAITFDSSLSTGSAWVGIHSVDDTTQAMDYSYYTSSGNQLNAAIGELYTGASVSQTSTNCGHYGTTMSMHLHDDKVDFYCKSTLLGSVPILSGNYYFAFEHSNTATSVSIQRYQKYFDNIDGYVNITAAEAWNSGTIERIDTNTNRFRWLVSKKKFGTNSNTGFEYIVEAGGDRDMIFCLSTRNDGVIGDGGCCWNNNGFVSGFADPEPTVSPFGDGATMTIKLKNYGATFRMNDGTGNGWEVERKTLHPTTKYYFVIASKHHSFKVCYSKL